MNLATSTPRHLKHRISKKFLLIFSLCSISLGGVVWACADYGYDYSYSSFSPEAFVAKEYTPFFYTEYQAYYNVNFDSPEGNNNTRYNDRIIDDWYNYFEQQISKPDLTYLLLKSSYNGIDSVYNHYKGNIASLPDHIPQFNKMKLNKKQVNSFLDYLLLAKSCENFAATYQPDYWDEKPVINVPGTLEQSLLTTLKNTKDPFIKQRVWFQLVRYYYFLEQKETVIPIPDSKTIKAFNTNKDSFPKNMMYFRTLGYVAGRYYLDHNYAMSNYLNSLCYNYTHEMKIPAKWSFHPQEESDWQQTLNLAKTTEEKITLWHLMGVYFDTERAIPQIMALDPKSEKLDLLLSRLINITEFQLDSYGFETPDPLTKETLTKNTLLVSSIAAKNNTSKPYFWNLAAGYMNFINQDYKSAASFYNAAKDQLPKDNKLIMAQYKLLNWTLIVRQLTKIDAQTEALLVEPLNWFADLKKGKDTIPDLRFYKSVTQTIEQISTLYKNQGDVLKANIFHSYTDFYKSNQQVEQLKSLLLKPAKTPFEQAMLRYYPYDMEDLYYYQATNLVYRERLQEAIVMMQKSGQGGFELLGDPFSMRLNDCHDCDHQMLQSKKFTSLGLLKMMKNLSDEIKAGRNVHNNAYLLANAYYNITHYGNARTFYQSDLTESYVSSPSEIPAAFRPMLLSGKIAEKYYLIARDAPCTREQKAKCVFMASKCERNDSYNLVYNFPDDDKNQGPELNEIFFGKYFTSLKLQYSDTQFYKEAINECGYFRSYATKK